MCPSGAGGQLIEQQELKFLPEDIKRKMDKAGITDAFYCEQLQKMLEEEGMVYEKNVDS